MSETSREAWAERSRAWAASTALGKAQDDTFNQMIITAAGICPGEAVLDIASGTGNPAVSIALAMDGRGRVIASDFTPAMLETARSRAEALGLGIMDFIGGDMTRLPVRDAAFDCVTCRFGLMSVEDKAAATTEAMRVLKPGGRAVYVVWGPYEDNPPFHVPRRAVARFFGEVEGPPPARHSMSAPGTLMGILDRAGFVHTEERELRYRNRVADPADYVARGLRRSFAKKVGALPADRFDALARAVLDAWAPFFEGGALHVPNYARLGIGWKPR